LNIKKLIIRLSSRYGQIGWKGFVFGFLEKIRNYLLKIYFRFDGWHVGATYHFRPYKAQVVEVVNQLCPISVVELGCGLGDILSRINSSLKYGIDIDPGVIRAARFINKKGCDFFCADLLYSDVHLDLNIDRVDCVIMVNFTHNLTFKQINKLINRVSENVTLKYMVIDIIKPGFGYKYSHSIAELKGVGQVIEVFEGLDGIRNFVLLRLN